MQVGLLILAEIDKALSQLPEYVTDVALWIGEGESSYRLNFRWIDDQWHVLDVQP